MKKIFLLIVVIFLLNGCGNEDPDMDENMDEQTIKHKVVLPDGVNLNVDELSVQSYIENSSINSGTYSMSMPIEDNYFTFVTDTDEKVILMGYHYPNQINFDLSAESTVIALAMSLPIMSTLSDDAKTNFVAKLKQSVGFRNAVANMEQLIIQGISPLDTGQTTFLNSFLAMFENSLINKKTNPKRGINPEPVNIITSGNKIIFQNGGKSYETSVGIYKDGQLIEHIELDRVLFVANSASEAFSAINNYATNDIESNINENTYEFNDDGEYKIKIRTGRSTDLSFESNQASIDNISKWALDFLLSMLPVRSYSNADCVQTILSEIRTYTVIALEGKTINTAADGLAISYDIAKSVVNIVGANFKCIAKTTANLRFLKLLDKVFGWESWVSRAGTLSNVTFGIYQWVSDDSKMDLCYQVDGNNISECESTPSNNRMIIRVTNLLGECSDCDTPTVAYNYEGMGQSILDYNSSLDYKIYERAPFIYIWTCYPGCSWAGYPVPLVIGESIETDEENPYHRKLRFTRIE